MKKILGLMLITVFALTLAGCKGDDTPDPVDCDLNPTHEDCQEPDVDCTATPDHPDCEEPDLDCTATPDHPDCVVDDEEPTVVRLGTHWVPSLDPNWVDPLTGEGYMAEDKRLASLNALDIVLDELNVEIEFVEYTGDIREQFLQSVIAQDPVADVVLMWGGR